MATYEITPLLTGKISCDKGVSITFAKDTGKKINIPSTVYLIQGQGKNILVDTGMCSTEKANAIHYKGSIQKEEERVDNALRSHGLQPEDIDIVILTHLHWDHCQNLNLFKNAKFYLQKKEYEFATNPIPPYHNSYEYDQPGFKQTFLDINFTLLDGDSEICEGISVITTPGHTPGHQSVVINTKEGKYIAVGDAVMTWENLQRDDRRGLPYTMLGRYMNVEETWNSFEKIISQVSSPEKVLPGHDFDLYKKRLYPPRKLSKDQMKVAIIGCGAVAKVHLHHFQEEGLKVVGLNDTSPQQLENFKQLFGEINTYTDYKEMIEKENPNIVSICTPPNLHKEQAIYCAERGIHILCEKPIATNLKDMQEMIVSANKNKVTLGIMLPRRFYNNTLEAKKLIKNKSFGDLRELSVSVDCNKGLDYYSTSWRGKKAEAGGGVLLGQSIHSIDRLLHILGSSPEKVRGKIETTRDYLEIEDEASGEVQLENGHIVKIRASANSDRLWQALTKIKGEKGLIILDSAKNLHWETSDSLSPEQDKETVSQTIKPIYYGPGHDKVIRDFISSLESGSRPFVEAQNSTDAMKVILGIYQSSNQDEEWINIKDVK